jgi:predicted nucleic acid-binding protein
MSRQILMHPFVVGEVAVGHLRNRSQILGTLRDLPAAVVASDEGVLEFIDKCLLAGRGLDYIDVHLLAAARLSHAGLWTADKRLQASAEILSLSAKP